MVSLPRDKSDTDSDDVGKTHEECDQVIQRLFNPDSEEDFWGFSVQEEDKYINI